MRSFRKILVLAAVLATAAADRLPAQETIPEGLLPDPRNPNTKQGTRGANFLEIGVGARGNAMGGAVAASTVGPLAWFWNPAGGAAVEEFSLHATMQNLYTDLDIREMYFGGALPFFGGVAGVQVLTLSSGDIPRTREEQPLGGDPVLGANYEWSSTAIGLSYARRLTDRLDLGGTLKYVTEGITDAGINWVAIDLGTQFRTGIYGLTVGAAVMNVGPSSQHEGPIINRRIQAAEFSEQTTRVRFQTEELELPTLFRFSVNTDVFGRVGSIMGQGDGRHSLNAELQFFDAIDTDLETAIGVEYGLNNMFFLRAGKRFFLDDREFGSSTARYGLSGGLGARIPIGGQRALQVDYAYTSLGELENVQVFSFEFGRR